MALKTQKLSPRGSHSIKVPKSMSFFKLILRGPNNNFKVGNVWLKKWNTRCMISQNAQVDHTLLIIYLSLKYPAID